MSRGIAFYFMAMVTAFYCGSVMADGKALKVYILAGQSNMQGHAKVETFDYYRLMTEHVKKVLSDIELKRGRVGKISYYLRKGGVPGRVVSDNYPIAYGMRKDFRDTPPEDRKMTKEERQAYIEEYRAKLLTPADDAMWQRGASNAGYHYLGCAKIMALIGKGFAEAVLEMEEN